MPYFLKNFKRFPVLFLNILKIQTIKNVKLWLKNHVQKWAAKRHVTSSSRRTWIFLGLPSKLGITHQSVQSRHQTDIRAATSKRGCLCTLRITKNLKQFKYEYYYYLPLYTLPRARYTQKTMIESMMNPTIQPPKSIFICSHLDSFFSTG